MPRRVVASTFVTLDGYIDEPGRWSFLELVDSVTFPTGVVVLTYDPAAAPDASEC